MKHPFAVLVLVCLILLIPIAVFAAPPHVTLKVDPVSGAAPLIVKVSEISGDTTITGWTFDFGDQTSYSGEGKGEHTYAWAGEYTVTLHVVNALGEEAMDSVLVNVTGAIKPPKEPDENTTIKVVYEGATPIKDLLSLKTKANAVVLKEETEKVMSKVSFPYNVTKEETKTTFKIVKYRCDEKMQICGYWIEAYRDGKEVYTNSPIWISPPPYQVVVSESFDEKTNEITTTLKEDPKAAVESVLQRYVEMQPLGKAVSYER